MDELGITENTIVIYSTDNGPHMNTWPDGGDDPFRSEKNKSFRHVRMRRALRSTRLWRSSRRHSQSGARRNGFPIGETNERHSQRPPGIASAGRPARQEHGLGPRRRVPHGLRDFYPEERPVHRVDVDGFWMDEHPVTVAEFRRFVKDTGYVTVAERPLDPADYPGRRSRPARAGLAGLSARRAGRST